MNNLINDPAYENVVKKMAGDLFDWLEQTNGMQIPIKRTIKHPFGDWKHKNQY